MITTRLMVAGGGVLGMGLVFWMVRAGRYPSRGDWVTRADNPITFWTVASLSGLAAAVFLVIAIFAP